MNHEIPVNLPSGPGGPMAGSPDFPAGPDLTLLMDIRIAIRERLVAMGLPSTGGSVGVGGADESFRLGDKQIVVAISIVES